MMEDGLEKAGGTEERAERQEIFSKAIRAGKRTYFFDVKSTKRNDYYLTITESKKRYNREGRFFFEKHKIFLYKEDFEKFIEGLAEVIEYIKSAKPKIEDGTSTDETNETVAEDYTNVDFEDLEEVEIKDDDAKEEE